MTKKGFRNPIPTNPVYSKLIIDINEQKVSASNPNFQKKAGKNRVALANQMIHLHKKGYLNKKRSKKALYSLNITKIIEKFFEFLKEEYDTNVRIERKTSLKNNRYIQLYFMKLLKHYSFEKKVYTLNDIFKMITTFPCLEHEIYSTAFIDSPHAEEMKEFETFLEYIEWLNVEDHRIILRRAQDEIEKEIEKEEGKDYFKSLKRSISKNKIIKPLFRGISPKEAEILYENISNFCPGVLARYKRLDPSLEYKSLEAQFVMEVVLASTAVIKLAQTIYKFFNRKKKDYPRREQNIVMFYAEKDSHVIINQGDSVRIIQEKLEKALNLSDEF